jgi:hypothetical protein
MNRSTSIDVMIEAADALTFRADALALKYAQNLYGVDQAAFLNLSLEQQAQPLPPPGASTIHHTNSPRGPSVLMFIGVEPLWTFRYAEIRQFGRLALATANRHLPHSEHIAFTIHGPGYGLDEIVAFESLLAGIVEAVSLGDFPKSLRQITFVERNGNRAKRLRVALRHLLPTSQISVGTRGPLSQLAQDAQEVLRSVGYSSASKPRAFVAMPFAPEMDDTFHYGIQGATNSAGMLCERADLSAFTGDVMGWVRERISTSRLVIADLSSANPNVYLEVGYAWGCGIPTVLLCKDVATDLKFDVKVQRCLVYR